jgi:hypothetical protein
VPSVVPAAKGAPKQSVRPSPSDLGTSPKDPESRLNVPVARNSAAPVPKTPRAIPQVQNSETCPSLATPGPSPQNPESKHLVPYSETCPSRATLGVSPKIPGASPGFQKRSRASAGASGYSGANALHI